MNCSPVLQYVDRPVPGPEVPHSQLTAHRGAGERRRVKLMGGDDVRVAFELVSRLAPVRPERGMGGMTSA